MTLSDVKRIAILAQLELNDAQAEATLAKLNGIFALVEQMQAVDTTGVEPLAHRSPLRRWTLRCACATTSSPKPNRRDDYQAPAPPAQDGLYLVPKVIE